MRTIGLCFLLSAVLLVAPLNPQGEDAREDWLAIVDATIVDGTGAEPFVGSVLVRGDRIHSVGRHLQIPAGRVVNGEGKTLIPGLFDLHTHLSYAAARGRSGDWGKNLKAYLYSGVTSVVDFGSYPEQFEPMRRLLEKGVVSGPRIHFAARIATPQGHGTEGGRVDLFTRQVRSAQEARTTVRELSRYEPDAIKVFTDGWRYGYAPDMSGMNEETLDAIVSEAHELGMEVLTHTVTVERAKIAARAGVDVIAHGFGDRAVDRELINLLQANNVTYAPTLAVYHPRGPALLTPLLSAVLEPIVREATKPPLAPAPPGAPLVVMYGEGDGRPQGPRARRWHYLVRNNVILHKEGITFGAGTDAGVPSTFHGWASLRELQLLVHAGLSPLDAITAATGNSAKAIHVDEQRGTIAAGKLADFVLIGGEPHRNITDIVKIERVFAGGREIDREQLAREITSDGPTPIPPLHAGPLLDDMEREGRESSIGTRWATRAERGVDHSEVHFARTLRPSGSRALTVLARMSHRKAPVAAAVLPLSPGGVEPVDASGYRGVKFEARGEGEYRLTVMTRAVRDYDFYGAAFTVGPEWKEIEIDFPSLSQRRQKNPVPWTGKDLTMLMFEIERPQGEAAWLELDNVAFYE